MKKETATINKLKQYINIYAFKVDRIIKKKKNNKDSWKNYLITTKRKKENVSENIDSIVYNQ